MLIKVPHPCSVLVCELSTEVTQVQGFCFVTWIEFLKDAYSTLLSCQLHGHSPLKSRRTGVLVSSQPKLHLSTDFHLGQWHGYTSIIEPTCLVLWRLGVDEH
jgi:hypothetical protein